VILALDGSLAKHELYQKASWAVIASDTDNLNGRVEVSHHSPRLPEREALLQALLAANDAQVPVLLLIDNQTAVRRLQAGLQFGCWHGEMFGFWSFVARLTSFGVDAGTIPPQKI
jgi:hypothetical protein